MHIDKLKTYLGTPPRFWLLATTNDGNRTVDPALATSPILPNIPIGSIIPPSTGQQSTPRPINRRQNDAGKQRDLGSNRLSFMLPTSLKSAEKSERRKLDDSSIQWDDDLIPVSGEIVADAPAFDHVTTTSAAVVCERKSVKMARRPLLVPTKVHATPAGKPEIEGRDAAGKSQNRSRAHRSVERQRSYKGRNSFGTVTADVHSAYYSINRDTVMSYSQLPPADGVPSGLIEDRVTDNDRGLVPSPERLSFELNPLTDEFVSINAKIGRPREEVYNADWTARESRPQRNRKLPKKFADFQMDKKRSSIVYNVYSNSAEYQITGIHATNKENDIFA